MSILLLYWGLNYLKGEDVFSSQRVYYVVYDNTEGLLTTRPVTISGYQVGQVSNISFHPSHNGQLIVTLKVSEEMPITKGTVARIYSANIMGEKSVSLTPVKGAPLALSGDTLKGDTERDLTEEVNVQLAPLKARTEQLIGSLDTAVVLVTSFLDDETSDNFKSTFESISKTFASVQESAAEVQNYLSDNKDNFDAISTNFRSLSEELASKGDELGQTITNIEAVSDSLAHANLAQTLNNLEHITARFDNLLAQIESRNGAAGKLIYDPEVYNNLQEATENLNRLLLDIKYNPNKYLHVSVFGSRTRYTEDEIQAIERQLEQKLKD